MNSYASGSKAACCLSETRKGPGASLSPKVSHYKEVAVHV